MINFFAPEPKLHPRILEVSWLKGVSLSLEDWELILSTISHNTEEVDLSANKLGLAGPEFLKTLFSYIRVPILKFNFSFNHLGELDGKSLEKLASNFPKTEKLDLSQNQLHKFSKEELIRALNNLPPEIKCVNLSRNKLASLGINEETLNMNTVNRRFQLKGNEFEETAAVSSKRI